MKKVIALALTLVMVFALCACTSTSTQQTTTETAAPATEAPEASETPTPSAEPTEDPSTIEGQIDLIYENLNSLKADVVGKTYWCTVTDLDHNGRLEFTSAITEGSDNTTTVNMYEVSSDYSTLNPVSLGLSGSDTMPEVIEKSVDTYKDANGVYYYVFTNTNSSALGGSGHYITVEALSLSNGTLNHQVLAYQDISYENGYTVYTTYDQNGVEQDPTTFSTDSVLNALYSNATKTTTNFDWFTLSEVTSADRLSTSYSVFAGTTTPSAPSATPTPVPTIQVIDPTDPIITKNPTSESITAGGSCDFIAQAIGYNTVRWQFVSPYGYVLDAASNNPYPAQMRVYGATTQTLTLSGVPQEMNGWMVQAVFTGDTKSQTSATATVSVSAAPTPSYVYITFSPSQGTTFYNTVNYVTVYSSNGQDIRVEATKSGDTGCYYSATISSGSSFPVQGIAGQWISVSVVATCGDSQTNATFYVDATPIQPTPDPEPYTPPMPTSDPGGSVRTGYVDSVNTVGGAIYVGVTFDDGSCGRYDISYMVSNPPNVGQRCTVSFASDGITITGFSMDGDPS